MNHSDAEYEPLPGSAPNIRRNRPARRFLSGTAYTFSFNGIFMMVSSMLSYQSAVYLPVLFYYVLFQATGAVCYMMSGIMIARQTHEVSVVVVIGLCSGGMHAFHFAYCCYENYIKDDSKKWWNKKIVLPNFQSSGLNASAELAGTPLAPLHAQGGALRRSPYVVEHLSDFLRYAVLWKRGGAYLDTDVIVMKSLKGIRNSLFFQNRNESDSVANGILFFDKQSPVLKALIAKCARVYHPQSWTSCGPTLVSRLAGDANSSRLLNFFNESAFFTVHYRKWETLFNPESAPAVLRAINGSYGVHFWNKFSKDRQVVTGSGSAMDVLARTHCPDVYKLASFEGYF
ncbi:hypothetical protein MTO96_005485 [Rhipicephalus appendiculatus]